MITIVVTNGAALYTNMSLPDFQSLIGSGTWVSMTEVSQGTIYLNVDNIIYYYNS